MPAKTILLAEDDDILREGTAVVLRREGYTVHPAADGKETMALGYTYRAQGP